MKDAIDDEYTKYTITLESGIVHRVEVSGMMQFTDVQTLFTETGFSGDVSTLMQMAD